MNILVNVTAITALLGSAIIPVLFESSSLYRESHKLESQFVSTPLPSML